MIGPLATRHARAESIASALPTNIWARNTTRRCERWITLFASSTRVFPPLQPEPGWAPPRLFTTPSTLQ